MASYTVTAPDFAAHAKSLVASTMDTVTFASGDRGGYRDEVEILIHTSQQAVYVTVNGTDAAVASGQSYVVLSGGTLSLTPPDRTATVVKLISGGTATYSVTGLS